MDFIEVIRNIREKHSGPVFLFQEGTEFVSIDCRQWERDVYAFASWLKKQGIRNQHIGAAMDNRYELFVVFFGTVISGNVLVSVNRGLAKEDLKRQIAVTDVSMLFIEREDEEESNDFLSMNCSLMPADVLLKEIRDMQEDEINTEFTCDVEKTAVILFSSGTSGLPKGVMLSQKNLLSVNRPELSRLTGGRYLCSAPLYHIGGIVMSMIYLQMDMTLCICKNAKYLLQDILKYKPNKMSMTPSQLELVLKRCSKKKALAEVIGEHVKAIHSFGAPMIEAQEECLEKMGVQLLNAYGMTEISGNVTAWYPHKKGSIGRIAENVVYRLKEGELQIKSDCIMNGYYNNKEAFEECFEDGWFCTGDLVEEDSEGFLFVKGRKKNIIILSNGENVCPEELETKIRHLVSVEEVVVYGCNDIIEAGVYLGEADTEDHRMLFKEQIKALNQKLPTYQKIQQVVFREEPFPKTGSGKLKRALE